MHRANIYYFFNVVQMNSEREKFIRRISNNSSDSWKVFSISIILNGNTLFIRIL